MKGLPVRPADNRAPSDSSPSSRRSLLAMAGPPARVADAVAEAAAAPAEAEPLPAANREKPSGDPHRLRRLVHRLRAPGGCPWDREQTPLSLMRYVLEEAYEVADAIEAQDVPGLREELGDLLLQVYLQAEIAEESGQFDISDVIRSLSEKLIRRHPHVFGDTEVSGPREVQQNWDRLKLAEKGRADSVLDRIPRSLPALARAQEVQRKLHNAGFDWPGRQGSLTKLDEELAELQAALDEPEKLAAELGDVLFMLAKLATDAGVDAEAALRGTLERTSKRFRYIEGTAAARGIEVSDISLEEQLGLWAEAKCAEREAPAGP